MPVTIWTTPDDYKATMKCIRTHQHRGRLLECPICHARRWTVWAQAEKHWMSHSEARREEVLWNMLKAENGD